MQMSPYRVAPPVALLMGKGEGHETLQSLLGSYPSTQSERILGQKH